MGLGVQWGFWVWMRPWVEGTVVPGVPLRVGQRSGHTSTLLMYWPCDSSLVAAGLWGPVEWRVKEALWSRGAR